MLDRIRKMFIRKSEHEKMYEYLCQATDRVHLEWLQREWDRKAHRERSNWQ